MEQTKGKVINFCERCSYSEEGEVGNNESGECPKCGTWMWTIYEYDYYEDGKVVGSEAGITDNDECTFHGNKLRRLKRIFDRGFNLLKRNKK